MKPPISVALVGCGAVADLYYAPALAALERDGVVVVTGLVDPDPARRALLGAKFPRAGTAATSM